MKTAGWIFLVIGILAFIGACIGGTSLIGGLFWGVLGAYLIYRAKQKAQEKKDKDDWVNGNSN